MRFFPCAILLFASATCSAEEFKVAVASNFIKPLQQIAADFEKETGHKVIIQPGSTGQIFTQAIYGAPFDLFLSADEQRVVKLIEEGLALGKHKKTYACGKLALWSNKYKLLQNDDVLLDSRLKKIAIANPKTAPYGAAAEQAMQRLKMHNEQNLIKAQNVTNSFQYAFSGAVDASFVAYSQLLAIKADTTKAWLIPADYYQPINQSMILLKKSTSKAARLFYHYLLSQETQSKIQAMGYTSGIDC